MEISVLMSAYNASAHLKAAIDSILAQSFSAFEFIIVNDGSSDSTEEIIKSYKDKRIVYVKNEKNLGLIKSLNKGLEIATGKYIARMDADDIALPTRLSEQRTVFLERTVVAVGSNYYLLEGEKLSLHKNLNDSDYQKTVLLFATCFCHPTVMMKNIFKEKAIRYDENFKHTEDYRLWTELSFYGEFYNIDKPLLKYRSHSAQVSNQNRATQFEVSSKVRRDYLLKRGFVFSEQEFEVHNSIGNNKVIRSKESLIMIEKWLTSLVVQNESLESITSTAFNKAIHKFWIDSCGNSALGILAFRMYFQSGLSTVTPVSSLETIRLLLKCIVRKFSL